MIFWVRGGVAGQYSHLGVGVTLRSFEHPCRMLSG